MFTPSNPPAQSVTSCALSWSCKHIARSFQLFSAPLVCFLMTWFSSSLKIRSCFPSTTGWFWHSELSSDCGHRAVGWERFCCCCKLPGVEDSLSHSRRGLTCTQEEARVLSGDLLCTKLWDSQGDIPLLTSRGRNFRSVFWEGGKEAQRFLDHTAGKWGNSWPWAQVCLYLNHNPLFFFSLLR